MKKNTKRYQMQVEFANLQDEADDDEEYDEEEDE